MSTSPNTSGRRRAGSIIGIGSSKRWARRLVARICRREGKIIARNRGEERYKQIVRSSKLSRSCSSIGRAANSQASRKANKAGGCVW